MAEGLLSSFTGERRMLIDGKLVDAVSGKTFDNINPATEEVLGQVADAGAEDMRQAIAAARRVFDETSWSTDHKFRQRCLLQLQEALEKDKEEMRAELIAEVGAPYAITFGPQLDVPLSESILWPAHYIDEFKWDRDLVTSNTFGMVSKRYVWKEAMGVIGAVTPWNYPFEVVANKLAQIIATGNTMVLKPAPDTPWNATRIGRLIAEQTDFPAGAINIITSSDHLVGEELTLSPMVDQISFTGSTATGKRIMEKGAASLKRVFLELGGKSATLVLDDLDEQQFFAAVAGGAGVCTHAGQGCAMQTRMLLPRSRYDEGVEILVNAMSQFPYGDPTDPTNMMGPVISERQRDRIEGMIRAGVEEGAKLVLGGERPAHLPKGWYVAPTVFADVDNSMSIAQDEVFGPVIAVIPYDDEADAIRISNDSHYGLSGGIQTSNVERGLAVARQLRTGSVNINTSAWHGADAPYGGYKDSGIGRQNGFEGFEQYVETKIVSQPG